MLPTRLFLLTIAVLFAGSAAHAGWQTPGDIQVPKGNQAVKEQVDGKCIRRVTVVGDALFDFDKSALRGDAEVTLAAAGPEIAKAGGRKVTVIGHTDAK